MGLAVSARREQSLQVTMGLSPSAAAWQGFTLLLACPSQGSDRAGNAGDAKARSCIMQT